MGGTQTAQAKQGTPQTHRAREARLRFPASAARPLLFGDCPLPDGSPGLREIAVELRERNARILLLIGSRQRHAELQEIVGRFGSLRVILIAFREGAGCVSVQSALIIGLAEPILGAPSERIPGVLRKERSKGLFGCRIIGLFEQAKSRVVLFGSRTAGQFASRGTAQTPAGRDIHCVGSGLRRPRRTPKQRPRRSQSAPCARAI